MSDESVETTLVFDDTIGGHHLEYLHHLHTLAASRPSQRFIFVIPDSFRKFSEKMEWKESSNITYHLLKEELFCKSSNRFKRSYCLSKLLKRIARIYNADRVFLISLMTFLPFLPFILGTHFKVSGIIYKIYLYTWGEEKIVARILDVFKYLLFSRFRVFNKIFLLNDEFAPLYLNKLYKCEKFRYLTDPYSPLSSFFARDFRKEWEIGSEQKIIIHFGGLSRRKGTLDIIKMLYTLSYSDYTKYVFVFAGVVSQEIREQFYMHYNALKHRVRIMVFDEFCSFEFIESLCFCCDGILIPYHETAQSSGVLGYAAQHKKPVIAPRYGLVGKIVRRNRLGVLFNKLSSDSIGGALEKINNWKWVDNKYVETRTVNKFIETLNEI